MLITIEGAELREMARNFGPLMSGKVTDSRLDGILLETKGAMLIATASNGTDWVAQRIQNVEIVEEGECVVPRDFFKTLGSLKGIVELSEVECKISAKQGKSKFSAMSVPAEDFPRMSQSEPLYQLRYNGGQWRDLVSYTAYAASESESRPVLQGINFAVSAESQVFVCTDSHRLAKVAFNHVTSNVDSVAVTIPAASLKATLSSFDLEKDVMVIGFNNYVAIANGNVIYSIRALEGNFPATERLIPTDFTTEIVIGRKSFIESARLLLSLSKDKIIACTIGSDGLVMKSRNETKTGEIGLDIEQFSGNEMSICFSAAYAIEALNEFKSDYVRFKLKGDSHPFIMHGEDELDANVTALILPIRTR